MNRRRVIGTSTATALATLGAFGRAAEGGGRDTIRVGLIGCGGRGTGAASQALAADEDAVLWAVGDAFEEPLERSLGQLKSFKSRAEVPAARRFVGIDAFREVLDSGVDLVLLAAPPGFRPQHLAAAVDAGVHIFSEKPMAVDPAGLKAAMAAVRRGEKKGVSIQHGFCWRFDRGCREGYGKVLAGELGRVTSVYGTYLSSPVRPLADDARRPAGMAPVEWQLRHWINFDWLAGGPLLEQAIHTVDKVGWAMGDVAPLAAVGSGGKVGRSDPGNVYDHYNVSFEYPGGVFCHVGERQILGCFNETRDRVICEDGVLEAPSSCRITGVDGEVRWRHRPQRGSRENMYQVEHDELFAALRAGRQIKGGEFMMNSTALAMLGAMAAHSGQRVTWDELWASELDLAPDELAMSDDFAPGPIPVPGRFEI